MSVSHDDGRARFDRVLNFRDVGRFINHQHHDSPDRSSLATGHLYRSARLDNATSSDRYRLLHDYRIRTILDLRTPTEHLTQTGFATPSAIPLAPALTSPTDDLPHTRIQEISYVDINLNGPRYTHTLLRQLRYSHLLRLLGLYALGYRTDAIAVLARNVMATRGLAGLATDSLAYSQTEIRDVFTLLADPSAWPVLIHCTQGKDRTGLVIALVLLLCGVSTESIERDYALSEEELRPDREEWVKQIQSIGLPESFADCPPGWVETVKEFIDDGFGGVREYLLACGVREEQMRSVREVMGGI